MFSQEETWLLTEKYNGEKSAAFFADVARLEDGVPLAYLIGSIPFLNTTISLDSKPLIPRPETEFWVEYAIKDILQECLQIHLNEGTLLPHAEPKIRILDLCAGSGCIGVAVAKACPASEVDFIELNAAHLPTIAKNCVENDITASRVQIYAGDLFTLAAGGQLPTYDFILSNPPYIDKTLGRTETSVVTHEPALALYGGVAGMELLAKIITEAPAHLRPHGQLWLEHEPEQVAAIHALATAVNFLVTTHTDQYNVLRFSKLVLQ